jgi:N-acyl-D-amino-acid deacylase
MIRMTFLRSVFLSIAATALVRADDSPPPAQGTVDIEKAISRGLAIVQKAASNYPNHRKCFSCHHQTLPMLAMVTARDRKLPFDEKVLAEQAEFTHSSFRERIESMKEGRGVGGAAMTVGYGLWALDLAGWKPDETTEAMVTYLLKNQQADGHWTFQTSRPPQEDSNVTSTVLAVHGARRFAVPTQREPVDAAISKAAEWLKSAPLVSHEDRVASLWGWHLFGNDADQLRAARGRVLAKQREDGGWGQLDDMASDAYATGQTLFALHGTGTPTTDSAYQRGVAYLLKTQCADGSWKVETRSKPIQAFFDNGDPHGEHQFISIPATSWAVAALTLAIDRP